MKIRTWLLVLAIAATLSAQTDSGKRNGDEGVHQYVVLLKRGPKWIPNKSAAEQPLAKHGRYLNDQMTKGLIQLAGPFLDDSGGLVIYNAKSEAEVRTIAEHDPGVVDEILAVDSIRPFLTAFDAATGKSPFKK